jgi:hypothetical protein
VTNTVDSQARAPQCQHLLGRDPLGPQFADNFIWASRFLQTSLALPEHPEGPASAARAISIDLQHAPSPRKPSRRADAQ